MTNLKKAARQALDALENAYENGFLTGITGLKTIDIITALRAALAGVNMSPTEQTEQTNTQFMEGYRIGLAEMREKCAKVCDEKLRFGSTGVLEADKATTYTALDCAAAIRAIKFEGDTGFRPVSEMIAEHKQDPKKAAAIEKAKMRKAEQEPVAWVDLEQWQSGEYDCFTSEKVAEYMTPLYATPVRTKDLTDDEISKLRHKIDWTAEWSYVNFARAVIAADREKNR